MWAVRVHVMDNSTVNDRANWWLVCEKLKPITRDSKISIMWFMLMAFDGRMSRVRPIVFCFRSPRVIVHRSGHRDDTLLRESILKMTRHCWGPTSWASGRRNNTIKVIYFNYRFRSSSYSCWLKMHTNNSTLLIFKEHLFIDLFYSDVWLLWIAVK